MAEIPPEQVVTPDSPAADLTATAAAPAPPPEAAGKACRCGHGKTAHEHYRRGADCSLCSCTRYSRARRTSLPFIGG